MQQVKRNDAVTMIVNVLVVSWTMIMYYLSICLLISISDSSFIPFEFLKSQPDLIAQILASIFGYICCTHSLLWAAYLHHEAAHSTILFGSSTIGKKMNIYGSYIIDWINGSIYYPFNDLRDQHVKHHVNKIDYAVSTNLMEKRYIGDLIALLEFVYIPACKIFFFCFIFYSNH